MESEPEGWVPWKPEPGWEYATTTGQRKRWDDADRPPDERPGWELDFSRGREGEAWDRFDYTEERYWKRRKETANEGLDPRLGVAEN